jgi:dipeptidyl aminopeptidase/acylaminoacyl peptidase
VTTPASYSGYCSIASDGSRLAYSQLQQSSNLYSVEFDAGRKAVAGQPVPLTQGSRVACCPDLSPDGRLVAFGTGGSREGISLIGIDGAGERQLTANEYRNRQPRWSPDGKLLAFISNRSGTSEVWTIKPDGNGLRQLTANRGANIIFCAWSPDGKLLAYDLPSSTPRIMEVGKPWDPNTRVALPPPDGPNSAFVAWNWSPDGSELVGDEFRADGSAGGIYIYYIYSFKTRKYQELTNAGSFAVWLKDGHTLLFQRQGKLFLADSRIGREREILGVRQAEIVPDFGMSPDGRMITAVRLKVE